MAGAPSLDSPRFSFREADLGEIEVALSEIGHVVLDDLCGRSRFSAGSASSPTRPLRLMTGDTAVAMRMPQRPFRRDTSPASGVLTNSATRRPRSTPHSSKRWSDQD